MIHGVCIAWMCIPTEWSCKWMSQMLLTPSLGESFSMIFMQQKASCFSFSPFFNHHSPLGDPFEKFVHHPFFGKHKRR
jgi:hypothetical protein